MIDKQKSGIRKIAVDYRYIRFVAIYYTTTEYEHVSILNSRTELLPHINREMVPTDIEAVYTTGSYGKRRYCITDANVEEYDNFTDMLSGNMTNYFYFPIHVNINISYLPMLEYSGYILWFRNIPVPSPRCSDFRFRNGWKFILRNKSTYLYLLHKIGPKVIRFSPYWSSKMGENGWIHHDVRDGSIFQIWNILLIRNFSIRNFSIWLRIAYITGSEIKTRYISTCIYNHDRQLEYCGHLELTDATKIFETTIYTKYTMRGRKLRVWYGLAMLPERRIPNIIDMRIYCKPICRIDVRYISIPGYTGYII